VTKIISEKELQKDVESLKQKVNGDLCPTEFSGEDLQEFMECYQALDTLETIPLYDNSLKRETVALRIRRKGDVMMILQRGKPVGD